jgi:hypothetical protein
MSTGDLLEAWRDAVRAAELAERLATAAAQAADDADLRAVASEDLAELAEQAAASAMRAADRARATATEASALAKRLRDDSLSDATGTVTRTRLVETEARDAYHEATEGVARNTDR